METKKEENNHISLFSFPDYFKSELMETRHASSRIWTHFYQLSRLLQIGINGNEKNHLDFLIRCTFPDYFKSELMETISAKL